MPNASILVVEDDSLLAETLQDQLRKLGYLVVDCSRDIDAARQKLSALAETGHLPDMVLVDSRLAGKREKAGSVEKILNGYSGELIFLTHTGEPARPVQSSRPYATLTLPLDYQQVSNTLNLILYSRRIENELRRQQQEFRKYFDNPENGLDEVTKELAEREERYRIVSDLVSDYCYVFRVRGNETVRLDWASESLAEISGFCIADIQRRAHFSTLIYHDDLPVFRKHLHTLLAGQPNVCEYRLVTKDGRVRWVCDHAFPKTDIESGAVLQILGAAEDITARKMADIFRGEQHKILGAIAQDQPLEGILKQIVGAAELQLADLILAAFLYRDGYLYSATASSLPFSYQRAISRTGIECRSGLWNGLVQGGTPVISPDILNDPHWRDEREEAVANGLRSAVLLPLKNGNDETLGVLAAFSSVPRPFEEQTMSILQSSADLAALAIERRQYNDQLIHRAMYDTITGLPNRSLLEDRLSQAVGLARRSNSCFSIILFDLDRFKDINDSLGHPCGDEILRQVAQRLEVCIRRSDTLARIGADEFTIILNNLHSPAGVLPVIDKILDTLRLPFQVDGHELYLNACIGYCIYPQDGEDVRALLKNVDSTLAFAKASGKNTVRRFEPEMNSRALERLHMANRLRRAIESGDFLLHYQPLIDLSTNKVIGLEALVRWNSPAVGIIPPASFIPLAEETGLVHPLGDWVLEEVCNQFSLWRQAGMPAVNVAINVSPLQFARGDFIEYVVQTINKNEISPDLLTIEITENVFMQDVDEAAGRLSRLRDLGVKVCIDDFGTAYSSLAYLRRLPVNSLKIDRTFIQDLSNCAKNGIDHAALVKAIITLAHGLKLDVLAEGVETEEQLKTLRGLGCDHAQGFLFAHPMPSTEVWDTIFQLTSAAGE